MLDLFAGTGQLGIEALSRGAKSALFVDKRADAVKLVRENLALCHLEENAQVICGDSLAALGTQSGRFDIIFLDPPYESGLLEQAMEKIAQFDILSPHGIMVAESPQNQTLPELPTPYGLYREYRYGKIKVSCHGGLTYSEKGIGPLFPDAFWIGWDYAHFGDRIELPSYGRKGKTIRYHRLM